MKRTPGDAEAVAAAAKKAKTAMNVEGDLCRMYIEVSDEQSLTMLSDPIGTWGGTIGSTLWAAALAFVEYFVVLEPEMAEQVFVGKRVLELGAGLGAVGMAVAKLGARSVELSDMADMVPLLRRNLAENFTADEMQGGLVSASALCWKAAVETPPKTFEVRAAVVPAVGCCHDEVTCS
jgi:hypothetical protein